MNKENIPLCCAILSKLCYALLAFLLGYVSFWYIQNTVGFMGKFLLIRGFFVPCWLFWKVFLSKQQSLIWTLSSAIHKWWQTRYLDIYKEWIIYPSAYIHKENLFLMTFCFSFFFEVHVICWWCPSINSYLDHKTIVALGYFYWNKADKIVAYI